MDPHQKTNYGNLENVEKKLSELYLDQFGREMPDPTPIAPPLGYKKQPSMVDHIRAMVARQISEDARSKGYESFEEANDFEVGDDFEPETIYEQAGAEGDFGPLLEQPAPQAPSSSPVPPAAAEGGEAGGSPQTPPVSPPAAPQTASPASSPGTAPGPSPGRTLNPFRRQ